MPPVQILAEAELTQLDSPDLRSMNESQWTAVNLTWSECCVSRYYAVRMAFATPGDTAGDLGLITNIGADNYWVAVNDVFLRD